MAKLIEINWRPNDRQLRQFGGIAFFAFPFLGWFWGAGAMSMMLLMLLGLACGAAAVTRPRLLQPLFVLVSAVTAPLGLILGELVLAVIYFGLFFPMAAAFRLLRRNVLKPAWDREARTYWQDKAQPSGPASYFRQWG
jgi:hypothetical protein